MSFSSKVSPPAKAEDTILLLLSLFSNFGGEVKIEDCIDELDLDSLVWCPCWVFDCWESGLLNPVWEDLLLKETNEDLLENVNFGGWWTKLSPSKLLYTFGVAVKNDKDWLEILVLTLLMSESLSELYTIFGGGGLRLFFNSLSEPLLVDTAGDNGGGGASLVGFNLTNGVSLFY